MRPDKITAAIAGWRIQFRFRGPRHCPSVTEFNRWDNMKHARWNWSLTMRIVFAAGATAMAVAASGLTPTALRTEYAVTPAGVDEARPRLSWQVTSDLRGQRQTAYRVLVASSPQKLAAGQGNLWDSGRVARDETVNIPYAGAPLASEAACFWKVQVWDRNGKASAWSAPASWTMGLLAETDWQAQWIGGATNAETVLLRREFTVKPKLRRAVAHVCGLGQYELSINGKKVGNDLLMPGWTKYDRTCLYDTYDVTVPLRAGRAVVGLFLGNGMFNVKAGRYTKFTGTFGTPRAIAQIRLEYVDGTSEIIGTDAQWRTHAGPITFSSVYGGEDYDARLEPTGWKQPGFDEAKWEPARLVSSPGGKLKGFCSAAPPIRAFDLLPPIRVKALRPGVAVCDLGQNAPIMPRLKVQGAAGARVRVIPAELVNADGSVDRGSVGGGGAWWQYTLAGRGDEHYFPFFFYHGCRYLQVELSPADGGGELPVVKSLEGVVVHSASAPVGEFECSNTLFNRIHTLIRWAQRANLVSVVTDCPHRERLGWLEQYHLNGPSLRYEFDLAQLFAKGMNDMADSQLANGLVPDIAPEYVVFDGGFRDSPEWGSAFVIVPWQQYEWTGDTELLRRYYDAMKRYVAYLGTKAKENIVSHGLGDWYDLGPNPPGEAQLTPKALTATAFYYYDAWILARTAALLGRADDAQSYDRLAAEIRAAFNAKFFQSATGSYATSSQCANAMPLVLGLVEPAHRATVLAAIVNDVQRRGNALTAGDVGYRYLLRALAEGGRSDVILAMNNQSDKPGYGYQLQHGATSLTEAWDAGRGSSQNHFMLGHIIEWFYHDLAGIGTDGPGSRRILIKPAFFAASQGADQSSVNWVKAAYASVHGRVVVSWKHEGDRFELAVTVPANTTATVHLPTKDATAIRESGHRLGRATGVKLLRQEEGRAVLAVESGSYQFVAPVQN